MKKYLYLKKLLTKTELKMAHQYAIIRHKSNTNDFDEMVELISDSSKDVKPYDEFCLAEDSTKH